jgi:hypothetical protein
MVGKCKHETSNFKHANYPIPTLVDISIAGTNSDQKLPATVTPTANPSIYPSSFIDSSNKKD